MATPRLVTNYPYEYIQLFERAGRERVLLEFKTNADAIRRRNYLYTVRRALIDQPEAYPIPSLLAGLVKFTIENNILIAEPAPDELEEIEKALENVQPTDTGTELPS